MTGLTQPSLQVLRRFRDELIMRQRAMAPAWFQEDSRFPVIALARALDLATFWGWTFPQTLRTSGGSATEVEGWPLALAPAVATLPPYYAASGTPLFPSDDPIEQWAAASLGACTAVVGIDRAIERASAVKEAIEPPPAMHVRTEQRAESPAYSSSELVLDTAELFASSAYRDDVMTVRRHVRDTQRDTIQSLAARRASVLALMRSRTKPQHQHFPSYSSTPAIDAWYRELSTLVVQRMLMLSCVPAHATFGGVRFDLLVGVVADQVGFALKHLDHCVLLREAHPTLRWSNLLTITQDRQSFRETVQEFHGVDRTTAETILGILSWDGGNPAAWSTAGSTRWSPAPPIPPCIRTSANQHLLVLSGWLDEPLRFLRGRLRQHYPEDWRAAEAGIVDDCYTKLEALMPRGSFSPRAAEPASPSSSLVSADGAVEIVPALVAAAVRPDVGRHAPRRIWVVPEPECPGGYTVLRAGTDVLCAMHWFVRTALTAGPADRTATRLWDEATNVRGQLRPEHVPIAVTIGRAPSEVTVWSAPFTAIAVPWTDEHAPEAQTTAMEAMRQAIRSEEQALARVATGVDARYVLASLLNAMDGRMSFESALRSDRGASDTGGDESEDIESAAAADRPAPRRDALADVRFAFGFPRLLGLFASLAPTEASWPPAEWPPVMADGWAETAVSRAGDLANLDQVVGLLRTGLAVSQRIGPREWSVRVTHGGLGVEARERAHWREFVARLRAARHDVVERLEREQSGLPRRLDRYVKLRERRELSLDPPPRIRRHFLEAALHAASQMLGADSFPRDALFGGVPFGIYRWITVALAAEALMRVTAADVLLRRDVLFDPRLVKTTGWRIPLLSRMLGATVGALESDARTAVQALVLDSACAAAYRGIARAPFPPLVRTSPDHVFMSTAGCLDEPFQFLLFRLRRSYAADWDRAVDSREAVFRQELYESLIGDQVDRFITRPKGIRIRDGGRLLTDIDAVAYDKATGDLALVQLKWQDPFGASLSRRASVARNFAHGAAEWVATVSQWLETKTPEEIRQQFGFADAPPRALRVRLFVLGRFASHFSDHGPPDSRAAWGTWPQVLNLVARTHEDSGTAAAATHSPLAWLDTTLRRESPFTTPMAVARREELIHIGGITVRVRVNDDEPIGSG